MGSSCNEDQSLRQIGPWGGNGGCEWDFTENSGSGEVRIHHGGCEWICQKVPSKPIEIIQPKAGITMCKDLPREVGPWGGNKGKAWDEGLFCGIDQIDVHVGNGVVHAIQCRYHTKDGKSVLSTKQGGDGATAISRIKLEKTSCEREYLVGIMGYYGPIDGNCCREVVRSISLYTNKGKYGPFGTEIGTFFHSPVSNAKVVGFHGKRSDYLDAIGVHVEHL